MTAAAETKQEFTFQTEIKQLLHILSHSLYQNREIALRELISNASDALNKLRHIQLSEEQYRDDAPLEITLEPNKEAKVLTIRDNGIGLTHDELVKNLGTIAHSGSQEFFRSLVSAGKAGEGQPDLSLIGQFGVGFYSSFMLADKVEVITRSYRDQSGWRWESDGTGRFAGSPAPSKSFNRWLPRLAMRCVSSPFARNSRCPISMTACGSFSQPRLSSMCPRTVPRGNCRFLELRTPCQSLSPRSRRCSANTSLQKAPEARKRTASCVRLTA